MQTNKKKDPRGRKKQSTILQSYSGKKKATREATFVPSLAGATVDKLESNIPKILRPQLAVKNVPGKVRCHSGRDAYIPALRLLYVVLKDGK